MSAGDNGPAVQARPTCIGYGRSNKQLRRDTAFGDLLVFSDEVPFVIITHPLRLKRAISLTTAVRRRPGRGHGSVS